MTAQLKETPVVRPAAPAGALPLPVEIDHSCRVPLMFLFTGSMIWLAVSLVFGIIASIKMHSPGLLAHSAALTFGRLSAIASSTFLYGFASQAAIASGLWLLARMGKTFLILPGGSFIAGLIWNIGILTGILGILAGDTSQHFAFQFPSWTYPILFVAFIIFGLAALLTFSARSEPDLYPSCWYLFAAFLIFPWIVSAAYLLLGRYPVRGIFEPVIGIWFENNFILLWLGSVGLGILFYFISKLSAQPLYSFSFAVFGFWFYLLFATASGFQNTPGLPNWMPNLSVVANVLILLPLAAIARNWFKTWAGHNRGKKQKDISSKYVVFSAIGFVLAILLRTLLSCPVVDEAVGLTIFKTGVRDWTLYAFIAMALFSAILHIVPRLEEVDWPSSKLIGLHYGLSVAGILVVVAALMLGGYVEANGMNSARVPFNSVVKQMVPYIGIRTVGLLLLLIAQLALLWNFLLLAKNAALTCCGFNGEAAR